MEQEINFEFPILSINRCEHKKVLEWIRTHEKLLNEKKLYIFGAGIRGNMMLKLLEEARITVAGFGDNNPEKQGKYVKEYPIYSMDEICADMSDKVILVSTENYHEIEAMLLAKGCGKDRDFFVIDSDIYEQFFHEFFRTGHIAHILFGDCFFTELDVDDLSGKTMGELALDELGSDITKVLSIHGMCIPGFYYLMKEQIRMGIVPKSVAFIVNIPFCNGIQTKLPQSQHSMLLKKIEGSLPVSSEEFARYVKLTEERSRNINAAGFSTNRVRNHDNVEKILTKSRYMYEFNEKNENIEYLVKLIRLLQENHVKPVPFIPALNFYSGVTWFGDEFLRKYNAICQNIKTVVSSFDVDILDMSMLLDEEYFCGERMTKFPNEAGKAKEIGLLKAALLA